MMLERVLDYGLGAVAAARLNQALSRSLDGAPDKVLAGDNDFSNVHSALNAIEAAATSLDGGSRREVGVELNEIRFKLESAGMGGGRDARDDPPASEPPPIGLPPHGPKPTGGRLMPTKPDEPYKSARQLRVEHAYRMMDAIDARKPKKASPDAPAKEPRRFGQGNQGGGGMYG